MMFIGCESKTAIEWETKPFIDAYGEENGVSLFITGEELSDNLDVAIISFSLFNDLISGGYKEMFSFSLNNTTSSENIIITDMLGNNHEFESYGGMIFNIDPASNEISRVLELMNNEELIIKQGEHSFKVSTKGFLELYRNHFQQANT